MGWVDFIARGRGSRSAISMSNTKKITASRKNRMENGRRALFFGSNPHSKGEAFSRSIRDRADRAMIIKIRARVNMEAAVALMRGVSITWIWCLWLNLVFVYL